MHDVASPAVSSINESEKADSHSRSPPAPMRTRWNKRSSEVRRSIFGSTQPERTTGQKPTWLQAGNVVLEVDGVKPGEAVKDKILALQSLAKDWSSYELTIYAVGSANNGRAIDGGGILFIAGHPIVVLQLTIIMPYRPAHGARLFKPK